MIFDIRKNTTIYSRQNTFGLTMYKGYTIIDAYEWMNGTIVNIRDNVGREITYRIDDERTYDQFFNVYFFTLKDFRKQKLNQVTMSPDYD